MFSLTRQSVAVQREGGIPVGKKILYQGPCDPSRSAKVKCNGAAANPIRHLLEFMHKVIADLSFDLSTL